MTPRRGFAPTRIPPVRSRRSRVLVTLLAGVVGVLVSVGGAAFAYWSTVDDTHQAQALADVLPTGPTPNPPTTTPAPNSTTVTVTFPQAATTTGHVPLPAADYTVTRYPAGGGSAVAVTASCTGTGTISCTESGVPDGQWQYTDTPTYGTNWVGPESLRSAAVVVDTTVPVGVVGYPVAGNTYGANWGGSVTGSASDAGSGVAAVGVAVQDTGTGLWWDGAAFASAGQVFQAASGTTSWSYPLPASTLTSGHGYTVVVRAVDGAGNVGTSTATPFGFDNTPPAMVISYPVTGGDYGPNWTGTITGTAGDPAGNLTGVRVSIADTTTGQWWNGASWQGTAATVPATGTAAWSYPLAVNKLSDDHRYEIIAIGTDASGNVGTSTPTSFRVDIATLSVAIDYPVTSTVYGTNWAGALAGTAGDIDSDLSAVHLTIQDTTAGSYWTGTDWSPTSATVTADGSSAWTSPLPASALTSTHGYTVTAHAVDRSGNTGTSSPVTWTYNNTAPTGTISSPVNGTAYGANWADSITGTATAATGLTVTAVALTIHNTTTDRYWTGTNWTPTATPTTVPATGTTTWTYPLLFNDLTSGNGYTVSATITDSVGNTTTTTTTAWTYTTTAPVVVITAPLTGTYGANWAGSITGTTTAGGSAVTEVTVSLQNATTGLWWDGAGFTSSSRTSTLATGGTPAAWNYPLAAAKLVSGNSYTVTAQTTDTAGNTGTSTTTAFRYDTTTPTGAITTPVTGTTYGANWAGTLTGTATAGAGLTVSAVTLTIQDTTLTNTYWNDTSWQTGTATVPATGTTTWNYPLAATTLTTGHTYTTTATITDTAGNKTTTTPTTWTYTTIPPTAVITYPVTGGAYGANWAGSISGTANTSAGLSVTGVALTIRNTTTGNFWTGAAWSATTATVPATGTTSWSYPLAASAFTSGDGYSVTAQVTDSVGNIGTGTGTATTFTISSVGIGAGISYPVSGTIYGANWSGSMLGTASPSAGLTLSRVALTIHDATAGVWWNGNSWQSDTATVSSTVTTTSWSYALAAANLTGAHSYTVVAQATDSGNNVATSSTTSFGFDTTAPVGVVGYPVAGNTYGANWGGSVTGSASDAGSGVAAVGVAVQDTGTGLWWDGAAFASAGQVFQAASGTTSWSYPLPASTLTSGHGYTVVVRAVDGAGNVGTSTATPFGFDNTPPAMVISYPVTGGDYGPNWTGTITGTAGDPAGNLTGVRVSIADTTTGQWWNGASWQGTAATVPATGTAAWSYPLAVNKLSDDHRYEIIAIGTDASGNVGTSTPTSFRVDIATLSVAIDYPVTSTVYGTNWAGALAGTAGDIDSDLSAVHLTIQDTTAGSYWTGTDWSPTSATVTADGSSAWTSPLPASALTSTHGYTVTAHAVDRSGNTGTSSPVTWTYNNTAPTGTISSPVNGTAYGANWADSITGTATAATGLTVTAVALTIHNTTTDRYWTGTNWTPTATPTTVPATGTTTWTYPLLFNDLTSGNGYTVSATITDSVGNTTTTTTTAWTYTTTAPVVVITAPLTGTYGANWAGSITGTTTAGGSAVTEVTVSLQNATTGLWWDGAGFTSSSRTSTLATGGTPAAWNYPLAAAKLVSGNSYTVTAQTTDTAGNTGTSTTTAFRYDTTTPTGAITTPVTGTTYGANWAGTLTGTATAGAGLTVSAVTLTIQDTTLTNTYWNDTSWQTGTATVPATGTTTWNYPLAATTLTTGHTYTTTATITDTAGNKTTTTPTTWTYSAPAAQLAITSTALSGAASSTAALGPVTVQAQDSLGNPVTAPLGGIAVTLSSTSTGTKIFAATRSGTGVTSVVIPAGSSSVAFYYGDTKAGAPALTAAAAGLTSATQSATITAATANKLLITSTALSGAASSTAALGPVTVQAQDSLGNPVTAPVGGITVTLSSTSTGKVFSATSSGAGTSSVVIPAGSSGVAFYYGDTKAGAPTLTAAAAGLTSATQTATITAATATKLAFGQQPTNTPRSRAFTPTVTVLVLDQFGNQTTSSASVTMAIQSGPSAGGLSGGTTRTATSGVATFTGLSISGGSQAVGTYVLQATSTGVTAVNSNSFKITNND